MPVELGKNPLRLHCLLKALDLNGFTPNLTSQIRPGINYWSNWNSLRFGGHNLNGFTPNSTSQIRPVELGVNPLR